MARVTHKPLPVMWSGTEHGVSIRTDGHRLRPRRQVGRSAVDAIRVGGITPHLEIASLAQTWNVPMAPHFMLEITGQVLCCVPNAFILEDVEGGSFRELNILQQDVGVSNGSFTPPDRPGHGILFDREKLLPYLLEEPS